MAAYFNFPEIFVPPFLPLAPPAGVEYHFCMKIVVYQPVNAAWKNALSRLAADFPAHEIIWGKEQAEEHLASAEVVLCTSFTEEQLQQARSLKMLLVSITGVDHLPLAQLKQRGVRLANTHGNARYVAEHTAALILGYFGRIAPFHNNLASENKWHGFWVGKGLDDSWQSLHGKTVSIIGAGAIGGWIARFLRPFGTRVTGCRRSLPAALPEEYDSMTASLTEAVDEGDIVVIVLPSTPETRGLFDSSLLKRMKGKVLVNVGRGNIIDEKALYEGLLEGSPAAAVLDAWWKYPPSGETEGPPSEYSIHTLPNVLASPHIAGFVEQAVNANIEQACAAVREYLEDGNPRNEVDLSRGY